MRNDVNSKCESDQLPVYLGYIDTRGKRVHYLQYNDFTRHCEDKDIS